MLSIVVVLLFVGVILYPRIKDSLTTNQILPKIVPDEIDLRTVRDAMLEKHGWPLERAEAAQTEYKRFLTLLQKKPGFMLIPWPTPEGRDDLDQFWHQHILDTAKYAADCQRLFGRMIHHNPHVVRGSAQESDSVLKTQRLYNRTFNSGTYGSSADPVFLTGCGACRTSDTDSSCDSSHSGGHGDGGHSCGGSHGCGHGCGGHGCGGGCGGH